MTEQYVDSGSAGRAAPVDPVEALVDAVRSASRYDLVLAIIPLVFVLAAAAGVLASVPLNLALAVGGGVAALFVADALFVNPPAS